MASHHRYPAPAIWADYLRAGGGLALTGGPLLLLDVATGVALVLGAFATLFAWFGLRTWTRQQSTLEVSDQAVALAGPRPQRVPLADLCEVRLAYFAPRRTREHGWFELSLKATGGQRLRVDSNLERFDALLARVIAAARAQRLPLDPTTLANLAELGLVGEAGAGEG